MEKSKTEYNGLSRLNKPILFHGLSSLHLGEMALATLILFIVISTSGHSLFGLFLLSAVWIVLLKGPLKKLNAEHKKGTPNYFSSYLAFSSTPRKIRDKHSVLTFIMS